MPRVFLGLGTNLGERLETLQRAVDLLAARGVRAVASSRVWATAPVGGPPDQPEFLNVVLEVDPATMTPRDVLAAANAVEAELGRVRDVRWGPRIDRHRPPAVGDRAPGRPRADHPASPAPRAGVRGASVAGPRPRSTPAGRPPAGRAPGAGRRGTPVRAAARGAGRLKEGAWRRSFACAAIGRGGHRPRRARGAARQLYDRADRERNGSATERSWRGWIATGLVVVLAAVAFVTIQHFTPATAPSAANTTGLQGYLVYPAPDAGRERLWIWDLAAGTVQPGPVVHAVPSALVTTYSVEDSWVGLTIPTGGWRFGGGGAARCRSRCTAGAARERPHRRVAGGRRVREPRALGAARRMPEPTRRRHRLPREPDQRTFARPGPCVGDRSASSAIRRPRT